MVDVVDGNPETEVRSARRSAWTLLAWPLGAMAILLVVWLSGYVYWQLRISRAIADLRRDPTKYSTQIFYANTDLLEIGSRGLHRLFREYDDAVGRGNEEEAFAFSCGIEDLLRGADEVGGEPAKLSGSFKRTRDRATMDEMRLESREYLNDWPSYEAGYAPWWKWWKGHRGRRE